jgi:putative toxin-antitoxin system antitoxin component (TIGR02293 family)
MVNERQAVVQELGGARTVGRTVSSDRELGEAIREGFRPAVVEELMRASGLTLKELAAALDLSPRSLQRRRAGGRLARYESDRLYRLARIVAMANKYLGDRQRALHWLKRPNRALGGVAPVAAIDTELGATGREHPRPHRLWRNQLKLVYQVLRKPYARNPFDGQGSYQFGRRWSSPGVRLADASEHQSLALLEYFVHLDKDHPPYSCLRFLCRVRTIA